MIFIDLIFRGKGTEKSENLERENEIFYHTGNENGKLTVWTALNAVIMTKYFPSSQLNQNIQQHFKI